MEMIPAMCQKVKEDTSVAWVDPAVLAIVYIFTLEGSLKKDFLEVGPSFD